MRLIVVRQDFSSTCVIGELLIDGQHFCWTLEPADPIPLGSYDVAIRWSDKFNRLMPHVEAVPGHVGIEIHWGNWPQDTEGCLLVGEFKKPEIDFIGNSHVTFTSLFGKLQDAREK